MKQIFSVRNIFSLIRFLLIPVFVCLYLKGYEGWTAVLLILSGVTDVVDGFIARHFGQITDLGKALQISLRKQQCCCAWCPGIR